MYHGPFRFDAPNELDLAVGARLDKIEASVVVGIRAQIVGPHQDAEEVRFTGLSDPVICAFPSRSSNGIACYYRSFAVDSPQ